ncbi:MAG: transcription elongation protein nusA (N utilization substance protein A) (L factor) [candidate division NC10 bacterium CSP1-5]|nr:MAG: transcription elongation protein nusA (N utilization substance protein A) (L factor) [candidate division NC10 bacterium CSP1-5]
MAVNLIQVIEQIGREKGIEREVLIDAVGAAILSASRKTLGAVSDLRVDFDQASGRFVLCTVKTVVEEVTNPRSEIALEEARRQQPELKLGDEFRIEVQPRGFGRIAAQTAKQVIIQRVREAERDSIYHSFKNREGELITGVVQRVVNDNVIVNVGKAEAILPPREQLSREEYRAGDRIRAYIVEVKKGSRGATVLVSRSHPGMLLRLFEVEVPEIAEGIVEIKAVAREPGERAKIAVVSRDSNVDPVGACVGYRGSRVQVIVRELGGEKIDIIPWRDNPADFVRHALAPAEVASVLVDEASHTLQVIVADEQLSLAIGRRGQNARLAAKLVGWKVDIKSRTELAREAEEKAKRARAAVEGLAQVPGIGPKMVERLVDAGFNTLERLQQASGEDLMAVKGIGPKTAATILAAIQDLLTRPARGADRSATVAEAVPVDEKAAEPEGE